MKPIMSRRQALFATSAILAVPAIARAADDDTAELLFVQTGGKFTLGGGELRLEDASPNTLYFTDRPERIVGKVTTKDFVDHWASGDDSFKSDPPNAVLTADNGATAEEVTVELRNPRLDGAALVYDVKVLSGPDSLSGEWASLFIDLIGRPLTPLSYAGVARRSYRRVMW
jgi:hypothetical protein